MSFKTKLQFYADIKPGEDKTFGILFLQCFSTGFASAFFFVTASVNFISKVNIDRLPLAYVLSGLAGFFLINIYKNRIVKTGIIPAYRLSLIAYGILCMLLYLGYLRWENNSSLAMNIAYLGYLMVMPFSTLFSLGFSTLCLRVYNMSQSKRLLALVSTGDTVAAILAYLFVIFVVKRMNYNSIHLLPLAAIFIVLSLLPLRQLEKKHQARFQVEPVKSTVQKLNFSFFAKEKFYLVTAIATFFSILAVYHADYTYLISVRYLAVQTEWKIAGIVSVLFCLIKSGELIFSFLSRNILNSKGMKFSLLLLPLSLVCWSSMGFLSNSIFSSFPYFIIVFLLLGKWSERVIRKGVFAPAMRVIYQVAPQEERVKLQTVIEGSMSQVSTIISGLFLLLISTIYPGSDTLYFLNLMTIAGFIIYLSWLLVTLKLFKNYKIKIQQYLQRARKHRRTDNDAEIIGHQESASRLSIQPNILPKESLDWQLILDKERCCLHSTEALGLLRMIAFYNPSFVFVMHDKNEEWLFRNLVRYYFSNNCFFSRVLITWYMERMPPSYSLQFMKEVYEISDLALKQEIVSLLNKLNYRAGLEEIFYFADLSYNCTAEIAWSLAAINDTEALKNKRLTQHLSLLSDNLKSLLLQLLRIIYEPVTIQEIEHVLKQTNGSTENHLFALELLDFLLDPGLKEFIIPVFEDIPFSAKRNKLNKIFPVFSLPVEQRLRDILMKDFKIIEPCTRQAALEAYFKITGDKDMLRAFAESKLENMSMLSDTLLMNTPQDIFSMKQEAIKKIFLPEYYQATSLSHLTISRISIERRNQWQPGKPADRYDSARHTAYFSIDDCLLSADVLGLAILSKLNLSKGDSHEFPALTNLSATS